MNCHTHETTLQLVMGGTIILPLLQFFDDIRDIIRKAPGRELIDLPTDHEARMGLPEEAVKLKVYPFLYAVLFSFTSQIPINSQKR